MSIVLLIANGLLLLAFVAHTFVGDKELHLNAPEERTDSSLEKQEKWTMARGGWHLVSVDLLLATIGLGLINFTNYLPSEGLLLRLLVVYFLCYGLAWLLVVIFSPAFKGNYWKLGQWLLLWLIAGLIFLDLSI